MKNLFICNPYIITPVYNFKAPGINGESTTFFYQFFAPFCSALPNKIWKIHILFEELSKFFENIRPTENLTLRFPSTIWYK